MRGGEGKFGFGPGPVSQLDPALSLMATLREHLVVVRADWGHRPHPPTSSLQTFRTPFVSLSWLTRPVLVMNPCPAPCASHPIRVGQHAKTAQKRQRGKWARPNLRVPSLSPLYVGTACTRRACRHPADLGVLVSLPLLRVDHNLHRTIAVVNRVGTHYPFVAFLPSFLLSVYAERQIKQLAGGGTITRCAVAKSEQAGSK